jgi:glycine/D-amino acid oxidase-like deaminating enzyme
MEETLKGFSASSLAKMSVQPGTLYLFRDEAALEAGKQKAALVNTKPTTYSMTTLDTARTVTRFPWLCDWKKVDSGEKEGALPLAVRVPGAVYVGSDWTADARQFVKGLVTSDSTVKFKFNTTASIVDGNTVRLVDAKGGSDEVVEADVVVLACGIYTNTLLPGGKRRLPMEGMRGFSIDLGGCAMADGGALPDVGIVDFSSGDLNFQLTPFGKNRVRIVGFADFVGTEGMDRARQDLESEGSPTSVLTNHVRFLFPSLTWESQRETWAGLRPMSPDNLPYVGRMAWEEGKAAGDVWVCCGHGSTGWTSATATAEVLAQTVFPPKEGATPEMAELTEALRPDRFAAAFTGSRFATVLDYVLGF